jgi:hypothetical protein
MRTSTHHHYCPQCQRQIPCAFVCPESFDRLCQRCRRAPAPAPAQPPPAPRSAERQELGKLAS